MKWLGTVSLIWSRQYFVLKTEIIIHRCWFGGCTAARWVVAGHIGSGGTYYMNGAGYIEGAGGGGGVLINGERPTADKHTGSHPPAMEQNVVIFIWWKICLDIEVHCVNIYCLSTRLVCILCRYLVSNVQLVCKLSTDHALLCGITKVLPYWWDIYWYWSCATAAHSRVRTVVSSSTICKGILSLDIFYDI